jgi:hypothetical protein
VPLHPCVLRDLGCSRPAVCDGINNGQPQRKRSAPQTADYKRPIQLAEGISDQPTERQKAFWGVYTAFLWLGKLQTTRTRFPTCQRARKKKLNGVQGHGVGGHRRRLTMHSEIFPRPGKDKEDNIRCHDRRRSKVSERN